MKVKEFLKKVNYATLQMPVILESINTYESREAVSFNFNGYPFPEENKTVHGIHIRSNKVVVYYK